MTDEELKDLAKDVYAGRVFTDRHVTRPEDLKMVFMTVSLLKPDDLRKLAERVGERGMIYEYLDKAGQMGVNGMPCFFSMRSLTSEEADTMFQHLERIKTAVEEA